MTQGIFTNISCDAMLKVMPGISIWYNMLRLISRILLAWLFEWKVFAAEPSFGIPAINITAVKGSTAVLPCSVLHLTDDYQVIWTDASGFVLTHNDRRVIDDQRLSVERPIKKIWDLHIRDVLYTDSGKYICQISTKPVKHQEVILEVLVPPYIVDQYSSSDMNVQEGDTVTLICNATGVPLPEISWFRLSTEANKENQLIGSKGKVLKIHNMSRECGGVYLCIADNGVAEATRKIFIFVEYAPEVHLPSKRMGQNIGQETILQCEVTAHPHGIMLWERNGIDLASDKTGKYQVELFSGDNDEKKIITVRIKALKHEDFGSYMCVAKNVLGEDKDTMVLYEYSTPARKLNSILKPMTVSVSDFPSTVTWNNQDTTIQRPGYIGQSHSGGRHDINGNTVTITVNSSTKLFCNTLYICVCLILQTWNVFQIFSFHQL